MGRDSPQRGIDMGLKGFEVGSVFIEVDGKEIEVQGISTEIQNVTTEWEPHEEKDYIRYPYEGTLSIRDFHAALTLRHMDKFKSVRMGGKII
jgi:hypothetical protein